MLFSDIFGKTCQLVDFKFGVVHSFAYFLSFLLLICTLQTYCLKIGSLVFADDLHKVKAYSILKFDSCQNLMFTVNFHVSGFFDCGQAYPNLFKMLEGDTKVCW